MITFKLDYLFSSYEGFQSIEPLKNPYLPRMSQVQELKPLLKDTSWIPVKSCISDESIVTLAAIKSLSSQQEFLKDLQYFGNKYWNVCRGFGKTVGSAVKGDYSLRKSSLSNGSLMKLEPIVKLKSHLIVKLAIAREMTQSTHSHPEMLRLVCQVIQELELLGKSKDRKDLLCSMVWAQSRRNLKEAHDTSRFYSDAAITLELARLIASTSETWDHLITNVIWVGGDTDTIGVLAGLYFKQIQGPAGDEEVFFSECFKGFPELYNLKPFIFPQHVKI